MPVENHRDSSSAVGNVIKSVSLFLKCREEQLDRLTSALCHYIKTSWLRYVHVRIYPSRWKVSLDVYTYLLFPTSAKCDRGGLNIGL